jgi:UDP-N-acetyl-2-amino-2-deoxyglucuronate dehydrogenase
MSDVLRFALVGTGVISNAYVRAAERLEEICITSVVSRSGRRPSAFAPGAKVEVASRLCDLAEPFDAVIVATPNGLHEEAVLEAARLGKHVLTEKVLAISLDACDRMIEACAKANVALGVSYQRRTNPTNRRLKKLLDQRAFGQIFSIELAAKFYRAPSYYGDVPYRGTKGIDGGGPFIQQAAHDLDLLTWFFGVPARVASTLGTFLHQIESEDHGVAIMKFDNGMIGSITASTCWQPGLPASLLTILSSRGTLLTAGDAITQLDMGSFDLAAFDATSVDHLPAGHDGILLDFARAVREGRLPLIDGIAGRKSVELIQKIYSSTI